MYEIDTKGRSIKDTYKRLLQWDDRLKLQKGEWLLQYRAKYDIDSMKA